MDGYIRQSREIIEKIIGFVAGDKSDPTQKEWMMIKVIAHKVIEPFFYWRNEIDSNRVSSDKKELDIYELSKKFDLDLSELNGNPNRVRMGKFIDKGFNILLEEMRKIDCSYDRETKSFIKKAKVDAF
ncbi:MAG: hypothetical protein QW292_11820 [Candidatus Parvarchaeota archaeon]